MSETTDIKVEYFEQDGKGKAYVGDVDRPDAEMTFELEGSNTMVVEHTEVKEKLRGMGVAKLLLGVLVEEARNRSLKIRPVCPYVKGRFDKDPGLRDVFKG